MKKQRRNRLFVNYGTLETTDREVTVVGIARDGEEAVRKAQTLNPDIVLMDVRMPKLDGVGATEKIRSTMPWMSIIMLTVFDDDDYVFEALENGASGYLLKSTTPETLVFSIRAVHKGAVLISPSVAQKLVTSSAGVRHREVHTPDPWVETLSRREVQVLELLMENYSNRDIAANLGVSIPTIKNYVSRIYDKLGAEDRFHAIRIAQQNRNFLNSN